MYSEHLPPVAAAVWRRYQTIRYVPHLQSHIITARTDFGAPGGWREIRGMRLMLNPSLALDPFNWTTVAEWYFDREGPQERCRRQIYSMTPWLLHDVWMAFIQVSSFHHLHA